MANEIGNEILGRKVKDLVSGFEGVAVSRTCYLNGCVRISIAPSKLHAEGMIIEEQWFDSKQVKVLKGGLNLKKSLATEGPVSKNPPRS